METALIVVVVVVVVVLWRLGTLLADEAVILFRAFISLDGNGFPGEGRRLSLIGNSIGTKRWFPWRLLLFRRDHLLLSPCLAFLPTHQNSAHRPSSHTHQPTKCAA
jgi:hypothetical protein